MDYDYALRAAWAGKAVLFVGSGFSIGARSLDGSNFPTGSGLAQLLCERAEIKVTTDLRQASSRFVKKLGEEALVDLLTTIFSARSTSQAQRDISAVPWKGIYTTNYDNILERASADSGKKLRPVECTDEPRQFKDNSHCVIHINGFVDSLTKEALQGSFKLTSTSYLTEKFRESAWSAVFTRQIMSAHAVFFVGYSLYDLEIQEILNADKALRDKTFFIEYPGLDEEEVELSDLNDFGALLPIGCDQFAADLLKARSGVVVGVEPEFVVTGFREQQTPQLDEQITHRDADIFDLLLQGRLEENFLWGAQESPGKSEYLFRREVLSAISAEKTAPSNYVIVSDLGNGKTVCATQLAQKYLKGGARVFWLLDESYDCFDDVDAICKISTPVLVVIENYARKLALVEHLSLKRNQHVTIVLTERSSVHEQTEELLYFSQKIIDVSKTTEVDLNKLSNADVTAVSDYLGRYGLWGDKASYGEAKKHDFIQRLCNAELHGVLLGVLKSNHIEKKFSSLFRIFAQNNSTTRTVVAAFVLKMLGVSDPAPHTIAALADSSEIFTPQLRNNPDVRQLFNNTRGTMSPKSSVLAEFCLQNFANAQLLVTVLTAIANSLRKKARGSEIYWKLYRDLASFKYIQRMLPEKGKRESLIQFYEGLKEVEAERENPHFWLQYAIARLTFPDKENLERAKKYLDTALGLAKKKPNYTTTDIETQYARYHLEYANSCELPPEVAFAEFSRAHETLQKITAVERHRREPYRPIRLYEPFFKKYGSALTIDQVQTLNNAAQEMLRHIKLLPYTASKEQNVIAAGASLRSLRTLSEQRINALSRTNGHIESHPVEE